MYSKPAEHHHRISARRVRRCTAAAISVGASHAARCDNRSRMMRMHVDELEIDERLVRRLVGEQFPEWADLPLSRVEPAGTDNAIFRLGAGLSVRLARRHGPTEPGDKEKWLP